MADLYTQQDIVLPVVPIRDGVVFPGTEMILTFGRVRSVSAIDAAQTTGKRVIFIMQKNTSINDPVPSDLYQIGTVGEIVQMMKNEGEINALVRGLTTVEVQSFETVDPFFIAKAREIIDIAIDDDEMK